MVGSFQPTHLKKTAKELVGFVFAHSSTGKAFKAAQWAASTLVSAGLFAATTSVEKSAVPYTVAIATFISVFCMFTLWNAFKGEQALKQAVARLEANRADLVVEFDMNDPACWLPTENLCRIRVSNHGPADAGNVQVRLEALIPNILGDANPLPSDLMRKGYTIGEEKPVIIPSTGKRYWDLLYWHRENGSLEVMFATVENMGSAYNNHDISSELTYPVELQISVHSSNSPLRYCQLRLDGSKATSHPRLKVCS